MSSFAIIGDLQVDIQRDAMMPGGSAALAMALAGSGDSVTLRSVCSTDDDDTRILQILEDNDVSTRLVDRVDGSSTTRVFRDAEGAETFRLPGIGIVKGAMMDIYDLFGHDVLIVDCADQPLRRFLSDLPAHTDPNVQMLGMLRHLDWCASTSDELEIAMRFDLVIGTARHYAALTGRDDPEEALTYISEHMPGTHLRTAVLALPDALIAVGRANRKRSTPKVGSPDLALPALAAIAAQLMARRAPLDHLMDLESQLPGNTG
jgi:hypothetical protein